jgi:hypothetical protein
MMTMTMMWAGYCDDTEKMQKKVAMLKTALDGPGLG